MADEQKQEQTSERKAAKGGIWPVVHGAIGALGMIITGVVLGALVVVPALRGRADAEPHALPAPEPASKPVPQKPTVQMEPFIVNLADTHVTRFLKCDITLEVSGDNVVTELGRRREAFRDAFIEVLSRRLTTDILNPEGKAEMRRELIERANALLSSGKVVGLYFTDLVIQ